ncbi:RHS repeat-associated protein [Prauserella sediminis]|uniref:RHS repeat-associated protein n=1 Tax=Prauserella sediminis TaxID=577680 RepID=A0A839XUG9_9PSEU|nr:DUF6531 domain-containing protein [Prauserella sediminis]MBB3663656.1 RHS repeat-associated protein [Prauserella sediminis]
MAGGSYQQLEDPVAILAKDPGLEGGAKIEDAIANAGIQVQAVNWVWEQVVGESLVETLITPITGDFEQIARGAAQWNNVRDALQAVRNNLNGGLEPLQSAWQGGAAESFSSEVSFQWTIGLEADAQAAKLIGMALAKVADGSKAACDKALGLIETIVNKLIEAAAMLPIPVVGWGRAVKIVVDVIQIVNAVLDLIDGITQLITSSIEVIQGIVATGTALSKLGSADNLNDVIGVANETGKGIAQVQSGREGISDAKTSIASASKDYVKSGLSYNDNVEGLDRERSAHRAEQQQATSAASSDTANSGGPTPARRPAAPADTSMAANAGHTETEARPREVVPGSGDPVDLATGQMFLTQQDLELAGVLPLVLERTHFSGYRVGRLFGPGWASTLDQRIEVEADAVYVAGADGGRLRYALPTTGGDPVVPATGSLWPLTRSADDVFTLQQPKLGRTLTFTGSGRIRHLSAIADRNGNRIDVRYGEPGADTAGDAVPSEVVHSGGYRVLVDSVDGLITGFRLANPRGEAIVVARFGYDEGRNLVAVHNSSGRPMRFTYDEYGSITQWTDRNGEWYRYHYDAAGRVTSSEGAGDALVGRWEYDDAARTRTFTDALGATTTYGFNEHWQLVSETDPLGNTTTRQWTSYNELLSETDALGRTTRWEYDDAGNVTKTTMPDGSTVVTQYNELGLPTRITGPDGRTEQRFHDAAGNLTSVVDPGGTLTRYTYGPRGALESVTDALGGTRRIRTDGAGLPVTVTDGRGGITRYIRDVFGRVGEVVDPAGGRLRMAWTIEGRLLSRTQPDGTTERWRYDAEGNVIEHVDALGMRTRTEYGNFDLPVAQVRPDGTRLEFRHDAALRLVSVRNPEGLTWDYTYDAAGRLTSETDFNGRTLRYRHDRTGALVSRTNGAGETVTFTRDALGNVVEKSGVDGNGTERVTRFEFDPAGRLVAATSPDAEVRYERDGCGRVLTETVNGATVRSSYDELGRRVARVTPSGAESRWSYDANGRPEELSSGGHTIRFSYDAAGREVRRRVDAGAELVQAWDVNHRLASQTLTAPNLYTPGGPSRVVQQRAYRYRQDGFLAAVDDRIDGSRTFDLDSSGRITVVRGHGWAEQYAYDASGNITHGSWPSTPDGSGAPEAQGPREYTGTLIRRAGAVAYEHDAQGRVVRRRAAAPSGAERSSTFTWDAEDRLTTVTTTDGTRWRYVYDPLGRRIAKQRLSSSGAVAESVAFHWDGVTLAEQTATGPSPDGYTPGRSSTTTWDFEPDSFRPVTQRERTRGGDGPAIPAGGAGFDAPVGPGPVGGAPVGGAPVSTGPTGIGPAGQPPAGQPPAGHPPAGTPAAGGSQEWVDRQFYALVTDLVGTPLEMIDPDGDLAWHSRSTIWGQSVTGGPQGGPYCPLRFPGQYHDPETGDNYNCFRFYDPAIGGYSAADPIGLEGGVTPHRYVANPVHAYDPLGLAPCSGPARPSPDTSGGDGALNSGHLDQARGNLTGEAASPNAGDAAAPSTGPQRPGASGLGAMERQHGTPPPR